MDPLIINHVIRHPLSRIQTNNFQDKGGCSINGFRSFLFEQGIVQNLKDVEKLKTGLYIIQDYRGDPISLRIINFKNFPLSDKILRMKNINFYFLDQSKPIHKMVSPEPHFVEEERNLIENHFSCLESDYNTEDIEDWSCFQMDNEGHLVSMISHYTNFQLSNESIEHLSNFPYLRAFKCWCSNYINESMTNLSLLRNLRSLDIHFIDQSEFPEILEDLGMFSNLVSLELRSLYGF